MHLIRSTFIAICTLELWRSLAWPERVALLGAQALASATTYALTLILLQ